MSTISHPKFGFLINMEFHNIMDEVVDAISHNQFEQWYLKCREHGTKIKAINVHSTYCTSMGNKYISFTPIAYDNNGDKIDYIMSNTLSFK